jgi:glutamine phosphoribosylpyrophosphate amidotransferase
VWHRRRGLHRNIVPVLIEGLRRLEYRGYDSCGVAVVRDGILERARTVSRVADLDAQTQSSGLAGHIGIAHTRWATHGKPDTVNAHRTSRTRPSRWCTTASSRTTSRCATNCARSGTVSNRRPIPKWWRT